MKKNMFIVDLVEIDQIICTRLCEKDNNNIFVDPNKYYRDKDGKSFSKYF